MPYNKNKIKVNDANGKTLVKSSLIEVIEQKIVFSFSFFKGKSICFKDFNNYYATESDSKKSISDFFTTLNEISKMDSKRFYSPEVKEQLHYNKFTDNKIIDRIENILIDGYGMVSEQIKQFERMYFEFSFSNGKRVISTMIYNNIFEILFIDSNHMVCLESCRNIKRKMKFEISSLFDKQVVDEVKKEYAKIVLFEMIIDDAKNGVYENINELIADFEALQIT